jgi:hypothetical protein
LQDVVNVPLTTFNEFRELQVHTQPFDERIAIRKLGRHRSLGGRRRLGCLLHHRHARYDLVLGDVPHHEVLGEAQGSFIGRVNTIIDRGDAVRLATAPIPAHK